MAEKTTAPPTDAAPEPLWLSKIGRTSRTPYAAVLAPPPSPRASARTAWLESPLAGGGPAATRADIGARGIHQVSAAVAVGTASRYGPAAAVAATRTVCSTKPGPPQDGPRSW